MLSPTAPKLHFLLSLSIALLATNAFWNIHPAAAKMTGSRSGLITGITGENAPHIIYRPGRTHVVRDHRNLVHKRHVAVHHHLTLHNSRFKGLVGTGFSTHPATGALTFPHSEGSNEIITLTGDVSFGFIALGGRRDIVTLNTSSLTFLEGRYDCDAALAGAQRICAGDNGADGDTLDIRTDITTMLSVSGFNHTNLEGDARFENSKLGDIVLLDTKGVTLSLSASRFTTLTTTSAADNITIDAGGIDIASGATIIRCDGIAGAFHLCGGGQGEGKEDVLTIGGTKTGTFTNRLLYELWTEENLNGFDDDVYSISGLSYGDEGYEGVNVPEYTGAYYEGGVLVDSSGNPIAETGFIQGYTGLTEIHDAAPLSVAGFERIRITGAMAFTHSALEAVELVSTSGTQGPVFSLTGTSVLTSIMGGEGDDTLYLGVSLDGRPVPSVVRFTGTALDCGRICGGGGRDRLLILGNTIIHTGDTQIEDLAGLAAMTSQWEGCVSVDFLATAVNEDGACKVAENEVLENVVAEGSYYTIHDLNGHHRGTLTNLAAVNVALGAGDDVVAISGGIYIRTISGDAGNDALSLSNAVILGAINGGGGDDTITLNADAELIFINTFGCEGIDTKICGGSHDATGDHLIIASGAHLDTAHSNTLTPADVFGFERFTAPNITLRGFSTLTLTNSTLAAITGTTRNDDYTLLGTMVLTKSLALGGGDDVLRLGVNDSGVRSLTTLSITATTRECASQVHFCGGGGTGDRLELGDALIYTGALGVTGFETIKFQGGIHRFANSDLGAVRFENTTVFTLAGTSRLDFLDTAAPAGNHLTLLGDITLNTPIDLGGGSDLLNLGYDYSISRWFNLDLTLGAIPEHGPCQAHFCGGDADQLTLGRYVRVRGNTPLTAKRFRVTNFFGGEHLFTNSDLGEVIFRERTFLRFFGTSTVTSITGSNASFSGGDFVAVSGTVTAAESLNLGGGDDVFYVGGYFSDVNSTLILDTPNDNCPIDATSNAHICGGDGTDELIIGTTANLPVDFSAIEFERTAFRGGTHALANSALGGVVFESATKLTLSGANDVHAIKGSAQSDKITLLANASLTFSKTGIDCPIAGNVRLCGGGGADWLSLNATSQIGGAAFDPANSIPVGGFERLTLEGFSIGSAGSGVAITLGTGTGMFNDTASGNTIRFLELKNATFHGSLTGSDEKDAIILAGGTFTLDYIQGGAGDDIIVLGQDSSGKDDATAINFNASGALKRCDEASGTFRICGGAGKDRLVVNGNSSVSGGTDFDILRRGRFGGFELYEFRNFKPNPVEDITLRLTGLEELSLLSGRTLDATAENLTYRERQDIDLGNRGKIGGASGNQRVILVGVNLGSVATGDDDDMILIAGRTDIRSNTASAVDAGAGKDVVILGGYQGADGAAIATSISLAGSTATLDGGEGDADVLVFDDKPLFDLAGGTVYSEANFSSSRPNPFPATGFETVVLRGGTYGQSGEIFLALGSAFPTRLSLEDVTVQGYIYGTDSNQTVYLSGDVEIEFLFLLGRNNTVFIGKRLENDGTTTDKATFINFTGDAPCLTSKRICALPASNNTLILGSLVNILTIKGSPVTIASAVQGYSEDTQTQGQAQAAPLPAIKVEYDEIALPPPATGYASGFESLVFEFDLQLANALIPAVQSITRDLALSAMRGMGRQGGIYSGERQLQTYQPATMKSVLAPNLTAEAGYEQTIAISEHGVGNTLWQSESGSQRLKAGVAVHILSGDVSSGEEVYEISGQASGFYLAYEAYTLTMQFYALGAWFDIADTKDGSKTHYEAIAEGAQLLFGGRVAVDMALRGLTLTPSAMIFWQNTDMDADYVYLGRKETTGMVALDAAWSTGALRAGLAYDGDYAGYEGGTQHYQAEPAAIVGFSQALPLAGGLQFRLEAGWRRGLDTNRENGSVRLTGTLAF